MAAGNIVRLIDIRAKTAGVAEATTQLDKLKLAETGVAVASDRQEKALLSVDRALVKLRNTTDVAYRDTARFEAGQRTLGRALDAGRLDVAQYGRQLDLLAAKYRNADAAQDRLVTGAGRFRMAGGFVGGLGVGLVSAELFRLPGAMRELVKETGDLVDTADRLGVGVEMLQQWRYAAGQSGVEIEALETSLQRFAKNVGDAERGTGTFRKTLTEENIELRRMDGTVRPLNDLLLDYADAMAKASSDQERLSLSQAAFGKGGAGMVNLLREGADAVGGMTDRARALGVVSEEQARKVALADDKWAELEGRFKFGLKSAAFDLLQLLGALNLEMDRTPLATDMALRYGGIGAAKKVAAEELRQLLEANRLNEGAFTRDDLRAPKGDAGPIYTRDEATARNRLRQMLTTGERSGAPFDYTDIRKVDRGGATSAIERQQKALEDLNRDLDFERSLIGQSATQQRVMNELRRAGVDAASDEGKAIGDKVRRIEEELAAQDRLIERLDKVRDVSRAGLGTLLGDLREGKGLTDAWTSAIDRMEERLFDIASSSILDNIFGKMGASPGSSDGGWLGRILGPLFGGARSTTVTGLPTWGGPRADGGYINGPGTGRSDSILARVSNGEFVVNASATGRHRQELEAINSHRYADGGYVLHREMPRFAGGGFVGAPARGGTGSANVSIVNHYDLRGADKSVVPDLKNLFEQQRRQLREELPGIIRQHRRDGRI